ncbi:MAG: GNAT family N-acetyltransferase [Proteobacteria bacterium]|nr:MAG: GNAT family N-acetyltransferase [Pseudomonadota bacterium]
MKITRFIDPFEYKARVLPFLMQNEAQNCLGIGIIDILIVTPDVYPDAYLWEISQGQEILGAAWMTPPHPIGLTEMSAEAVGLLVDELLKIPNQLKGVVGPKAQADLFLELWARKCSEKVKIISTMQQRIYQLTEVSMPFSVPGHARVVEQVDFELLAEWSECFIDDCGLPRDSRSGEDYARRAIASKSRSLWIVEDKPVAMAGVSGPTPSGIRVSWVYTPNLYRGKGYASAVVAAISQQMLDEGRRFCFLYTDLANPTSNSIYQKIGYRAVSDSVHHVFDRI